MKRLHWGRIMATAGLTFALLLGVAGSVLAGKSLRIGGKIGTKLQYRLETENETNVAGITVTENQSGDVEIVVQETDANANPRFEISFANFEASLMRDGNLVERDPQLNGVVVHVTMSPRGELVEFIPKSNLSDDKRELVKKLIDAFFAYLPEADVDRDDSWVHKRHEESKTGDDEPSIDGETEYVLEGFEKKDGHECAKIAVEGAVKVNTPTPAGLFGGTAKTEGQMYVALAGGHVVHSKLSTIIAGKVGENEISRVQDLEIKMRKN